MMRSTARTREHDVRARFRFRALCPLAVATVVSLGAAALPGQRPAPLIAQLRPVLASAAPGWRPFYPGERLEYTVRLSGVGLRGRGAMWTDGPEMVRGVETYVLHFGFKAKLGLVKVSDRTQSWLDPRAMASLRFVKRERHPFSSHDEDVEMFPAAKRWTAADGRSGDADTDAPLDELSFIYFLRTVPLVADSTYRFDRHFDAQRNPTMVKVVRREQLTVRAGSFATVLVEMRVKDPARYRGEGVIRIHFSDDERRLPLRIESVLPAAGTALLTLDRLP